MKNKYIFMIAVGIFLVCVVSLTSAAIPHLGTFRANESIELKQTCTINGSFCDDCNISSVDLPDGERAISNVIMTKREGDFNFSFDGSNTTLIGTYRVNGFCRFGSDVLKNWAYYLDVTPNGRESTVGLALFYIGGVLLMIFFIGISFYGLRIAQTPAGKLFSFYAIWISMMVLFYIAWIGATNYLYSVSFVGIFFKWVFIIFTILTFPMVIASIVWYLWLLVSLKEIQQMIDRGVPEDRAYASRVGRY
jgi:hypothetical protein